MSPNRSWTQSLNDKQWKTNSVFRLKLQTASVKIVQFYVHCQNYFWQPQNPLDTMITSPSWRLTEAKGNMSKFSPCLDFHECDLLFLNKTGSLKMRFWFVCFFIWGGGGCLALRILISFIWVKRLMKWGQLQNCNTVRTKSASLKVCWCWWRAQPDTLFGLRSGNSKGHSIWFP